MLGWLELNIFFRFRRELKILTGGNLPGQDKAKDTLLRIKKLLSSKLKLWIRRKWG